MTIVLTGGAGFIGSHLAVEFLNAGHEVVIADNFSGGGQANLAGIAAITGKSPKVYDLDVCDEARLTDMFSAENIDLVVHCAGYKPSGRSRADPIACYQKSLFPTLTLIKSMSDFGVRKLIFSSSSAVYDITNQAPYTEEMAAGFCASPFGTAKFFIEKIITDSINSGLLSTAVILRYFNPAGAHPSGLIGELTQETSAGLMASIVRAASGSGPELKIFGQDFRTRDGTCIRDFIHPLDLAAGHLKALNFIQTSKGAHVFNLGTGTGCTVMEIIQEFERTNSLKIPFTFSDRRPGDIAESYADTTKAAWTLDWKANRNLADICRDVWSWQKNQ
ncbi:MAG: UDP-glucose 4-epimerase GalE [Deltaproteobacteria bacterium]|jgi:UDP-glucose 4-epimerase|nr:UDP-glucose 4-epimerase GalE [Deltaproteobacteria bacterium]